MLELTNYTIDEILHQSEETIVYRGYRTIDQSPFIIKVLKNKATPKVAQFHHTYHITKDLNLPGIIQHYELQNYENTCFLILEDIKGEALKNIITTRQIEPPLPKSTKNSSLVEEELGELLTFLYLAIQMADCLYQLHAHNIIHQNIQPAHIIVNLETGQVKLTDFGQASRLSSQKSAHLNLPATIYMSPEQSGQLNSVVDYRTDFYSLGLVFYEMLIGHLPFEPTKDGLAHLNESLISPHSQNPNIPPIISYLVMKLLAKTADARYQSAISLKADLQACLHQLTDAREIAIMSPSFQTLSATSLESKSTVNLTKIIEALQAISGEIVLNHLIKKFMSIVIENTGAEQGWLILKSIKDIEHGYPYSSQNPEKSLNQDHLFIQAYATALEVKILKSIPLDCLQNKGDAHIILSKKVITYVADTKTPLILNDDNYNHFFPSDTSVKSQQPKSILCLPIIHQQELRGVFYLENNLTINAFTQEHLSILKLLSTQIAISIENAFFYGQLEQTRFAAEQARHVAEHARQNAETANRAKSSFLANMSHELRTPLNAILGYSEIIQEDAEELGYSNILPDLDKIQVAGVQLLGIISDILDISKIEAEKLELNLSEFAVVYLVEEMVTTIQLMVEMGNNTLKIKYDDNLGMLYTDYHKVGQIILNLLNNASKFTSYGTITLTIIRKKLPQREPNQNYEFSGIECCDWLFFQVADTGIGISPEQINKIFEPFTQGDNSTTREYGGTGLGLTICEYFCRAMGGNLSVSSEVGKGSIFTVQLPARVSISNEQ